MLVTGKQHEHISVVLCAKSCDGGKKCQKRLNKDLEVGQTIVDTKHNRLFLSLRRILLLSFPICII